MFKIYGTFLKKVTCWVYYVRFTLFFLEMIWCTSILSLYNHKNNYDCVCGILKYSELFFFYIMNSWKNMTKTKKNTTI